MREKNDFLIAAQNKVIRTNDVKARIDKTQQNSRCRLCGDRDETINLIISECSRLVQRVFWNWHDWMGKGVHWELCKEFKFEHTNKWYMHNQESVQDNLMHKLLWDFEIQADHLISARRLDLVIVNKREKRKKEKENLPNCGLCCSGWSRDKTERKGKEI